MQLPLFKHGSLEHSSVSEQSMHKLINEISEFSPQSLSREFNQGYNSPVTPVAIQSRNISREIGGIQNYTITGGGTYLPQNMMLLIWLISLHQEFTKMICHLFLLFSRLRKLFLTFSQSCHVPVTSKIKVDFWFYFQFWL